MDKPLMPFWPRNKVTHIDLLALNIAQVLSNQNRILANQTKLLNQGGYILTTLTDVRNAISAIQAQVTLIVANHDTASAQEDADLTVIVGDLNAVSTALAALIPPPAPVAR